jgi:hypothetical protein
MLDNKQIKTVQRIFSLPMNYSSDKRAGYQGRFIDSSTDRLAVGGKSARLSTTAAMARF